jgi:hypothetical protein
MPSIDYEDIGFDIRADLKAAHRRTWARIAAPGTWFDSGTRLAIAAELRNADACDLCARRKEALSPYTIDGVHDSLGDLPEAVVEIVHRVVTDPGRLTQVWYQSCLDAGLTAEEYVETVGVTCSAIAIDTFAYAAGIPLRSLPDPVAGEPTRIRPAEARQSGAWVPWIAPEDARGDDIRNFGPGCSNIQRALSLVQAEAHGYLDLDVVQYLKPEEMRDIGRECRAISRSQIELIAGRVSYLSQCAY